MADGLAYFKKVYNDIPNWVQVMYDYNPKMLDYYTDIRGEAFKDLELSAKEKDEFIASVNAGRLYERSMVLHTQAAIIKGSLIEDLVEYFLVAYVYAGKNALELSLVALENALKQLGKTVSERKKNYFTDKEVYQQIIDWTNDFDNTFIKKVYSQLDDSMNHKSPEIVELIMSDGKISKKRKYLNLVGQYITELRGHEVAPTIEKARSVGVTEAELADLGYIVMITAGIPSWFELSAHLHCK